MAKTSSAKAGSNVAAKGAKRNEIKPAQKARQDVSNEKSDVLKGNFTSQLSQEGSVMNDGSLKQLFIGELRETYWAELHLTKALPKMIAATSDAALKKALTDHLGETEEQVTRIVNCLGIVGVPVIPKKCDAMEGLTMSGEHVIENTPAGIPTRDLGITMSGLKVENFEATTYKGLIQTAGKLGLADVAAELQQNLDEELAAGELLESISASLLGSAI